MSYKFNPRKAAPPGADLAAAAIPVLVLRRDPVDGLWHAESSPVVDAPPPVFRCPVCGYRGLLTDGGVLAVHVQRRVRGCRSSALKRQPARVYRAVRDGWCDGSGQWPEAGL